MKHTLVVYKSNTGLTRRYAQWIAEALGCSAIPLQEASASKLAGCDLVIYGGPIHAGMLQGLKRFVRLVPNDGQHKRIIFATGAAPMDDQTIKQYRETNLKTPDLKEVPFYYFESGMNYAAMSALMRFFMKRIARMQAAQADPAQAEEAYRRAEGGFDNSNPAYIQPLVDYVKSLG